MNAVAIRRERRRFARPEDPSTPRLPPAAAQRAGTTVAQSLVDACAPHSAIRMDARAQRTVDLYRRIYGRQG